MEPEANKVKARIERVKQRPSALQLRYSHRLVLLLLDTCPYVIHGKLY